MNAHSGKFVAALALLALASCAVVAVHDAALEDSRAYVYAVRSDPTVIAYAPAEIDQAVAMLRRADDVAARGGSLTEVHDLAALARDRATLAQQSARMKAADVAAQAERQRLEVAARTREAEAAQRAAREAQMQADSSRQQAITAQQQAAAVQQQVLAGEGGYRGLREQLSGFGPVLLNDRGMVLTLNDIDFDRGAATLQPVGQQAVSRLAAYLSAHPELVISVEGFTDNTGNVYRNEQLSERRALAVQSALAASGVDSRRILVRGYGGAYPIAGNETAAGRQMNSRVEIVISDHGFVTPPG